MLDRLIDHSVETIGIAWTALIITLSWVFLALLPILIPMALGL